MSEGPVKHDAQRLLKSTRNLGGATTVCALEDFYNWTCDSVGLRRVSVVKWPRISFRSSSYLAVRFLAQGE